MGVYSGGLLGVNSEGQLFGSTLASLGVYPGGLLGAYSGSTPEDWVEEDGFIVSADSGPLMMRFVAGVVDVTAMDPTFCEMLACRIAEEAAPAFKGLDPRERQGIISNASRQYRAQHRKAVVSNAIEIGPIAQVENRYVTVRA